MLIEKAKKPDDFWTKHGTSGHSHPLRARYGAIARSRLGHLSLGIIDLIHYWVIFKTSNLPVTLMVENVTSTSL